MVLHTLNSGLHEQGQGSQTLECQKTKCNRLWHKTTDGYPTGGTQQQCQQVLVHAFN